MQCNVVVLLGQPGVLDVVFRAQVVLQLQGSSYEQKELTRVIIYQCIGKGKLTDNLHQTAHIKRKSSGVAQCDPLR